MVERYGKQIGVPQLQPGTAKVENVAAKEAGQPERKTAPDSRGSTDRSKKGAPAPTGVSSKEPVDLLAIIDPSRDSVKGTWNLQEHVLVSPVAPFARLHVPYVPPGEYVLELKVTRKQGVDALGIGIAVGEDQGLVLIDGYGSTVTGLHTLDGKKANANETTRKLRAIPPGTVTTVSCVVRKTKLLVQCNGETILDWSGDYNRLSPEPKYAVPDKRVLFLAAYESEFHISQLNLRPIIGEGKRLRD